MLTIVKVQQNLFSNFLKQLFPVIGWSICSCHRLEYMTVPSATIPGLRSDLSHESLTSAFQNTSPVSRQEP